MRTNSFSMLFFALCAIALCSCDSNKGKVKELATQFVTAYNEGDKATIYDLFPIIKTYESLSMNGSIGQGDEISVEKNDSTDSYIATINVQKQQRLVFAIDSLGTIKLIDTYGVFRLDSISNEVALKAGVPVKKMSDIEVAKLMNSQSDFINDLRLTKEVNFLWTNYGGYSWSRTSSEFNVTMTFTIRNSSSNTVSGKDYYVIVSPQQKSTGRAFSTKTIDGVDLAPNEMREFNAIEPSLYNYASERDLSYTVEVKYRTESILSFLLNYSKFEGNEYEDFMKHPYRAKIKAQGKSGVVNSGKKGIAYAYKDMSDKSKVVDTLYHRKGINVIWESESWASVYDFDDKLIGYMKAEDVDTSGETQELPLAQMKLKSDDGKVNVYDANDKNSEKKVIKTLPAGQEVLLEITEDGEFFLYERQSDGSVKKIGRINGENIDDGFDD